MPTPLYVFWPANQLLKPAASNSAQREFLVGELQFLKAQDVDLALFEPVHDVLLADFEGIDVPGGDFHK